LTGVAGLLMSPNRGLFVYTPLMLFASLGAVRVWQERAHPWLRYLTVGVLLHTLVYGKFSEWWGGYAYGPRYMTDVLPALTILLVYGLVPLWRFAGIRPLIVLLTLYGVGVYAADDRWNREPVPLELQPGRVWDWSDLQITRAWHNGWRAGELAPVMFDAFRDRVPARVAPMTESDLASAITMRSLPAAVRRGTNATGVVEITNRGNAAWPAFSGDGVISSRYLVFLLARWFQQGQLLEGAGDVLPLPKNLPPGETVSMPFSVAVPSVAGDLELELRVTQAVDRAHGLISQDALRVLVKVE
jgi:hypothetical protein